MKRKVFISLALILSLGIPATVMAQEAVSAASAVSGASATESAPEPSSSSKSSSSSSSSSSTKSSSTSKSTVVVSNEKAGTEFYNDKGELVYVVKKGDNLTKIAKKYGTTYQAIAKLNQIANANLIYPGQEFVIPGITLEIIEPTPVVEEAPVVEETPVIEEVPVVEPEVVTSASPKVSSDPAAIAANMSAEGTWIHSIVSDVTFPGALSVEGVFYNKDNSSTGVPYRKLSLYTQDDDHNVTADFTLTVDALYVTSPNFRIQQGTVVGDIYVNARGFELYNTIVEGNVYFQFPEHKETAKLEKGTVTGVVEIASIPDATSRASVKESASAQQLIDNMANYGYWIHSVKDDVVVDGVLKVDGVFYSKGAAAAVDTAPYRKLALYSQVAGSKDVDKTFTLTADAIYVTSPNFKIQEGVVKGDVYVNARGFTLTNTTIEGNLYFRFPGQFQSADLAGGTVTGEIVDSTSDIIAIVNGIDETDVVTSATTLESAAAAALIANMASYGNWIHSITDDVTVNGDLHIDGDFYRRDTPAEDAAPYRKLALYTQLTDADGNRGIGEKFTLTVDNIYVTSNNLSIQNGTVAGNIYVDANGFNLVGCTVEGDVVFATQEQFDSKVFDENTVVNGEVKVAE